MSLIEQKYLLEAGFNPQGEDTDDEDDENRINKKFFYEWTKWMRPDQLNEYLDRFTCIRVPTGSFERCFLYYRRYPKDFGIFEPVKVDYKTSLYQANNKGGKHSQGFVNLNKSKIEVKTFSNPYAVAQVDQKKEFKKVTKKIVSDLPMNRTMLVVTFDEKHTEEYIRGIFGVMGKLRRVVSGDLRKNKKTKSG
jgi:hypothetical protein